MPQLTRALQEKCKKAKMEANGAQNGLEKEITTLRDTNRTLQLRLRDIEVANDDFERQARHTSSSLEDLESKYSQAIERSVLMEEEIKLGEQEREALRIETQRLREELSDLQIEAEILQDKIKKAENRQSTALSTDLSVLESPVYEDSPRSTASSPLIRTPPEVDLPSPVKDMTLQDPPSPPMSDASTSLPRSASKPKMPAPPPGNRKVPRLPSAASTNATPRPRSLTTAVRASPSQRSATGTRTPVNSRPANPRTSSQRSTATQRTTASQRSAAAQRSTTSTTLTHIRTLAAQMQRLEARVHNVRSKLPAPTTTPPRASPRGSAMSNYVPSTATARSRHGGPGSTTSSTADETPQSAQGNHIPRLSMSGVSRLSFGPLPNRNQNYDPDSSSVSFSRPSSRASFSSSQYARPDRPPSRSELPRPMSRSSFGRAKTPSGPPPRLSMSGGQHGHSQSIGYMEFDEQDESDFGRGSSRTSYSRSEDTSSIPLPSAIPVPGMSSAIPVPGRSSTISGPRTTSGRASMGRSSTISGRAPSMSFRTSTTRRASVMHKKPVDLGETY